MLPPLNNHLNHPLKILCSKLNTSDDNQEALYKNNRLLLIQNSLLDIFEEGFWVEKEILSAKAAREYLKQGYISAITNENVAQLLQKPLKQNIEVIQTMIPTQVGDRALTVKVISSKKKNKQLKPYDIELTLKVRIY